ncbi:MAG: DUF3570 domain-containing protein [Steroidobacteraceae bacterium]|nr:DUF3570 domain-containing protein [Steroidobacteraceae bacterium]MDW8257844.1 DUF3570 domain-containing protein [Gammaproteobacteria bacterium]
MSARRLSVVVLLIGSGAAGAGVLPEDRADLLYHRYDGGGVTIDGPSVLVRKGFAERISVVANYYVDMVTSASIDVVTTASPYEEKRTQYSVGLDYLRGKSTYSLGYIDSSESDYEAKTLYLGISQDMFGDLTTISFGIKYGQNDVFKNLKRPDGSKIRDPGAFGGKGSERTELRSLNLGLTQVLTRSLLGSLNYELITDEGFLNNPYRQVRFADSTAPNGYRRQDERYPATRTSHAASVKLKYSLPWWRAAVEGSYRFFNDTWGITGHTASIGYTHPLGERWILEGRYRYYTQNAAEFYSDLFPRRDHQNFLARDKELATFISHTIGVGASWEFRIPRARWLEKSSLNLRYDHLLIDYEDYRDIRVAAPAGTEPLYSLDANVIQVFVSAWF